MGPVGPVGPQGTAASPEDLLDLLRWAFRRIRFLEAALKVEYGPRDQIIPPSSALVEEDSPWT
jgi:hypothetical protein